MFYRSLLHLRNHCERDFTTVSLWRQSSSHRSAPLARQGGKPESPLTDDLTARLTDLFRHYEVEFRRRARMSEREAEQVTKPFRAEVKALIAEYGGQAVVRAALQLPAGPPTVN